MAGREEEEDLITERDPLSGGDGGARASSMSPICDPGHWAHRIVVLVFMCFLGFGKQSVPTIYEMMLASLIAGYMPLLLLAYCILTDWV